MVNLAKSLLQASLAGCLLAMATVGCILPQEQNVFPDLPPRKNTPPKIEEVNYVPSSKVATVYIHSGAGACASVSPPFAVTVVDNDMAQRDDGGWIYSDTLYHRWVIDEVGQGGQTFSADLIPENLQAERRIVSPTAFMTALGRLTDASRHLVQVYVTDGQFGALVTSATPYKGQDAAYVDSFSWYVEVVDPCQ